MRLSKRSVAIVFLVVFALVIALPAVAFAAETASTANSGNQWAFAFRSLAAALAIAVSAIAAGYAQANIGAAGAGTLAERPEDVIDSHRSSPPCLPGGPGHIAALLMRNAMTNPRSATISGSAVRTMMYVAVSGRSASVPAPAAPMLACA